MSKILQLAPHVADLIAAGEVVERPSSVVKELVENSIDAGATALTVEIKNGGMTYIRVTDNGCGMSQEDAPKAFLRHATSKLYDEYGLEAIGTLGFRGEALAAISAVSRIELLTREKGGGEATAISMEAGAVLDVSPAGSPEGTTIIVRDLFFNTPARLKYMKKDSSEGAAVSAAVIRCALSHPEVSVRYIKDGREELHTPGDGKLDSCIYSVFGSGFSKGLLNTEGSDENLSVRGFVTPPSASRGNRGWQFFFVNGRYIKSALLQAALEQAYKNVLFTGKFPGCVLHLEMKLGAVDVNVHPAKTEVKFLNEKGVFDGVYYAVLAALRRETEPPQVKIAQPEPVQTKPRDDFFRTVPAKEFREEKSGFAPKPAPSFENKTVFPVASAVRAAYLPSAPALQVSPKQETITGMSKPREHRVIGEALGTYIVVETGDKLLLIDKHAAHERIIFDRLKAEGAMQMSQLLLAPLIAELGEVDAEILLDNEEMLSHLGFELGRFGSGTVALRRLPADIETKDAQPLLSELAEKLRRGGTAIDLRDEVLQSVACKAAIKAGRASTLRELEAIAERVISGEIKYCPHGRPVSMELSKSALDKGFKRI